MLPRLEDIDELTEDLKKSNGRRPNVSEARQQLEADRQRRVQAATEKINKAIAEIEGGDIRCKVEFVIITHERNRGTEKRVMIEVMPMD